MGVPVVVALVLKMTTIAGMSSFSRPWSPQLTLRCEWSLMTCWEFINLSLLFSLIISRELRK